MVYGVGGVVNMGVRCIFYGVKVIEIRVKGDQFMGARCMVCG